MDEFMLSVQSEHAGDLGYISFLKDELTAFMAIDYDIELDRDFIALEENSLLLKLTFTLATLQNPTPGFGLPSSIIMPNVGIDTTQNPNDFSTVLVGLADPAEFNHLGNSFYTRFEHSGDLADIASAISTYQRGIQLAPEGHPDMPGMLTNLGASFCIRFQHTRDIADISKAISTLQRAVYLTPERHENMLHTLSDLGNSFLTRFEHTRDIADIADAISTYKRSIQLTPEGHSNMPLVLSNLGLSFDKRFERTGDLTDISSAISTMQTAIQLTPEGHERMPVRLRNLGKSFQKRFECSGDLADISSAISTLQRAVHLTPEGHADMPSRLSNLRDCFQMRFVYTSELTDIDSAISAIQKAVQLIPEGHRHMTGWLNNLGNSFCNRFERTGELADISSAISTLQRAVHQAPERYSEMSNMLSNLGTAFQRRFGYTDDLADISNAITTLQNAIQLTPEGHAEMPFRFNNLGNSLRTRFGYTRDLADIESAITTLQKAVQLMPEDHTRATSPLINLGSSFLGRFQSTGDLVDLASAISTLQNALRLSPKQHQDKHYILSSLGDAFMKRCLCTDDLADSASAISTFQRLVHLLPEGHANMSGSLTSLGAAFSLRFELTSDLADIESAISTLQQALQLTPEGNAHMPGRLANVGSSFYMRFKCTGNPADIANGISILQRAIGLFPEGNINTPLLLGNLGNAFKTRFESTCDLSDITSAISTLQKAIHLISESHVEMPALLSSLGSSFQARFEHAENLASITNTEDIQTGISMFRRSATHTMGRPSTRLEAARKWAQLSRKHDKSQSWTAYSVAIQLLPQLAGLEQTIHKRHKTLIDVSDITTSATAAAIDDSELETALAWLEQGRCLVWKQLNHLRTPAEDLRAYNPSLADRFIRVAGALEISGSRQEKPSIFWESNITEMISLQEESHTHIHLAKEWNDLLLEIRRIPEFHDFLQPPQVSKLLNRLPLGGPVVIFNLHEDRCDALALLYGLDCPIHIPLETFSLQKANQLCKDIRKYLTDHRVRQRQEAERGIRFRLRPKGVDMYDILRELWEHVAKPILNALAYSPHHSNQPRIWWCPTGPLAFLPIHAAGIYGKGKAPAGPCVSDYVVSSYIPSVSALLDKINQVPTTDLKPTSLLIISQPSTPGQSTIPGAKQEAQALVDMIGPLPKSLLLEDAFATVMRVKEEMKTHDCVHFACHAIQDADDSLKSGVQLHDGRLELLEMMKQTLPNAGLAFLSACQTSTGDEKLSDEAVHLAAGMLAAGYRSVVATMWSIKDEYGPVIAKAFYSHILPENLEVVDRRLDGADAARALHYATQKIRTGLGDTEEAFLTWVPYVHFGV